MSVDGRTGGLVGVLGELDLLGYETEGDKARGDTPGYISVSPLSA
jgi:hypothetical protein